MAVLTASLPMYNLPEMKVANAAFWAALRLLLMGARIPDLPNALSFERKPVPERIEPTVLFLADVRLSA